MKLFRELQSGLRSHIRVRSPHELLKERIKKERLVRFAKNLSGLDVIGRDVLGLKSTKKKRR